MLLKNFGVEKLCILNSAREMQPLSTCFYVEQAQHNTPLLLRQAVAKRK